MRRSSLQLDHHRVVAIRESIQDADIELVHAGDGQSHVLDLRGCPPMVANNCAMSRPGVDTPVPAGVAGSVRPKPGPIE